MRLMLVRRLDYWSGGWTALPFYYKCHLRVGLGLLLVCLSVLQHGLGCMFHISWHVQSYYVSPGGTPGVGL
jgi:hypothetical protein